MINAGIAVPNEHQKVETTAPQGYTPSPEEKKTLALVERLFQRAKEFRRRYDEKWLDNYKMFRGKQWKEQRPSYRHSEVINMVWQVIQSQVPILTDARQRFEFLPEEPSDTEFAKILDQVAENDWQRGNWSYRLTESLYDGHFIGTGIGEVGFDPEAKDGLGAITLESADPAYCFPDPNAFDVNHPRSRYFIFAEPTDIEVIKRQYPKVGKFVKPDLMDLHNADRTELNQVRYKSPVDNVTVVDGMRPEEAGMRQQALKITLYLKDDTFDETEKREIDPATGEEVVTYEQKLKYPNGRKVCVASGIVLEDGAAPFEDGRFPFAAFRNYIDPRSFWGISEVEPIEGPQRVLNKVYSFALDVLTLMGNPIWIVDDTADIDTDNLFNRPGLVVEKAQGSEVRREEGVALQPWVLQLLDRVKVYMDDLSGSQDISRGAKPEGVTAASAISALQEAAQTRIRQKSRNLDAFLQDLGQLYKARVFQFYSSPRIIRLTNNEMAQEFFKFHVVTEEQPDGTVSRKAYVRPYVQQADGSYAESLEQREFQIKGDFDVRVTTGSALPFAKDMKFQRIRQMFLDGVVDDEEYLKNADLPNWEAILARVNEKKAMMAAQAQAAQGMPAQGGIPGGAPAPVA